MTWGSTQKDLKATTIFKELPKIARRHWPVEVLMILVLAGVSVMATALVPLGWRIEDFSIMFPAIWTAVFQ